MYIVLSLSMLTYQSKPQIIDDCYYVNTSLDMIEIYSRIQVNLQRTNNTKCTILQPGLNVSIKMNYVDPTNSSNVVQIEVYDYVYDFNYMTTDKLQINVNQSQNASFKYFYLARSALVTINSITYQTEIMIGLINRQTADNSIFIISNDSKLFFTETQICYNTTLRTNYVAGFQESNLINITAIITMYSYKNGTVGNLTMIKVVQQLNNNNSINAPPPNQNVYNNSTIQFDQKTNQLNICYPVPGYATYQSIDISESTGYLEIYYKAENTTLNNSVILYFTDNTYSYVINSMPALYNQLFMILMRDRLFVQRFVSDKNQQYYENILAANPDSTTNKLIYMYCQTDSSVYGAVYSKTPFSADNGLEIFTHDYYQPNYSAIPTIDVFYNYKNQNKTCDMRFEYTAFVTNQQTNKTVIVYNQLGTKAYFTCFDKVMIKQTSKKTQFTFVPNDFPCLTFNKSGDSIILVVFNNLTNQVQSFHMIDDFGTENLVYNVKLNYTINTSQSIVYLVLPTQQLVDAAIIEQLSEVNFDVLQIKGIAIILFGIWQAFTLIMSLICKRKIIPAIQKASAKRKEMLLTRRIAMGDGL